MKKAIFFLLPLFLTAVLTACTGGKEQPSGAVSLHSTSLSSSAIAISGAVSENAVSGTAVPRNGVPENAAAETAVSSMVSENAKSADTAQQKTLDDIQNNLNSIGVAADNLDNAADSALNVPNP